MSSLEPNLQADVDAINSITAVPTILEMICRTTGMGFAALARVTDDRWIACSVRDEIQFGLQPGGELKLETTICHEIRQSGEGVIIDHVEFDDNFRHHHTPAMYGFQSYISLPITRRDGTFFGTLCAIDPRPAQLNKPEIIGMFKLYADLIAFHLNAIEQLADTQTQLLEEQKTAELREQFIAVLGHDLRNPVGAILTSAQLLMRIAADDRTVRIANIIQDSSYRMKGLIDNIMDFASGRLGGGISLNFNSRDSLETTLKHVVTELQTVWPDYIIEADITLTESVICDVKRIGQLLSNLLGNAITHGQKDGPVKVKAITDGGVFKLSVTNQGKKISAAAMERLFEPFERGEVKAHQEGLGLGLYIASRIASAHDGTLDATSTDAETCFIFTMPTDR